MADKSAKESISENVADDEQIKFKDDQEKKLVEHILANWQMANAARQKWMQDKEEGLNLYWGIRRPKDFPFKNCANLHVPLVRTIADTLHSNIMGSIDTEKPAAVAPVGPEDVPKARKTEKLLNWQFSTQVDYSDMVDKISQSALIYGIAPAKVRYVVERDTKGKKKFDGLKIDIVPPERFLIPPDASNTDVNEMEFVIQEIPFSKSDLKKRMASNMFKKIDDDKLDRLGMNTNKAIRPEEDYLENVRAFYTGMNMQLDRHSADRRYSTVLEWYGLFDLNGDGIDEPLMAFVLKDGREVLRVVPWERSRPFVIITVSEILHKGVGESIPDLLKDINKELDTLHNQRVDAVTVSLMPPGFFDPVAGFNPNEINLTPGTMIPTNGPPQGAVNFPTMNAVRPEMYQEEDRLFNYAERMLGAGENVQGIMQTKRITATEVAAIDRRAGIRFLTIFDRFRRGIRNIFKLALELDQEHMPAEIQVRINGMDSEAPLFETITRDDLSAQLDIVVNGNSIMDDQADKQEMMQAYQIGIANPIIAGDPMALYELTRDLYLKLGVKRIDAYLRKPEDQIPKTPEQEHNLFMQEENVEPNLNEDFDDHLGKHANIINDPEKMKLLSKRAQQMLIAHYSSTMQMKGAVEKFKLLTQLSNVNAALLQSQMSGQPVPGVMGMPQQGPPLPAQSTPGQPPMKPQANGNSIRPR